MYLRTYFHALTCAFLHIISCLVFENMIDRLLKGNQRYFEKLLGGLK